MFGEKNARRCRLSSFTFRAQKHQNGKSKPQSPIRYLVACYFLHLWYQECVCIGRMCKEDDAEKWLPSFCCRLVLLEAVLVEVLERSMVHVARRKVVYTAFVVREEAWRKGRGEGTLRERKREALSIGETVRGRNGAGAVLPRQSQKHKKGENRPESPLR